MVPTKPPLHEGHHAKHTPNTKEERSRQHTQHTSEADHGAHVAEHVAHGDGAETLDVGHGQSGCLAELEDPQGKHEDGAHDELRDADAPRQGDRVERFLFCSFMSAREPGRGRGGGERMNWWRNGRSKKGALKYRSSDKKGPRVLRTQVFGVV